MWGYVKGGMGMVSFILCDIAREAGAVVAPGIPVARIVPGRGVELEDGTRIDAPAVVPEMSNVPAAFARFTWLELAMLPVPESANVPALNSRRACWPVNSLDDLKLAPFHLLASEGVVHTDKPHLAHGDDYEALLCRHTTSARNAVPDRRLE